MSKPTILVSILIAAIILAGGYFLFFQDNEGDNTNNANTVAANQNMNATNVNTATNDNENTNVNALTSDIDTSDWLTYENEEYGYSVKYPSDATYQELTSGINDDEDLGYIVNFSIGDLVIRILASNNAGANTLNELVNSGVPLSVNDKNEYLTISVNNKDAWRYNATAQLESGTRKIGANSILLGETYYYQIATGSQFAPVFTSEREELYDAFVSTFELL
ncbi:MAG: hypothetical protein WC505_06470 [Patescibacteria group bacterium]